MLLLHTEKDQQTPDEDHPVLERAPATSILNLTQKAISARRASAEQ